jgi:hypothetical protein
MAKFLCLGESATRNVARTARLPSQKRFSFNFGQEGLPTIEAQLSSNRYLGVSEAELPPFESRGRTAGELGVRLENSINSWLLAVLKGAFQLLGLGSQLSEIWAIRQCGHDDLLPIAARVD